MSSPQHREIWTSGAISSAESWPPPMLRDTSEDQLPQSLTPWQLSLLTSWTSAFTGKCECGYFLRSTELLPSPVTQTADSKGDVSSTSTVLSTCITHAQCWHWISICLLLAGSHQVLHLCSTGDEREAEFGAPVHCPC